MKIGIDIDGVITDFVDTFTKIVAKNGHKLDASDIREHDLYKVLGVSKAYALKLIMQTLSQDLNPQPGAIEALKELSKKHEIIIITARPWRSRCKTREWLAKHKVPFKKLIFLKEGSKHKHRMKLDVIIDDNLAEVIHWTNRLGRVIVYDHLM